MGGVGCRWVECDGFGGWWSRVELDGVGWGLGLVLVEQLGGLPAEGGRIDWAAAGVEELGGFK